MPKKNIIGKVKVLEKIVEKPVVTEKVVTVEKPVVTEKLVPVNIEKLVEKEIIKEVPVVQEVLAKTDPALLAEFAAHLTDMKSILGKATSGGGGGFPSAALEALGTIVSNTGNVANNTSSNPAAAAVLGTVSDAAVTSNANGTISAKLRGLTTILGSVWDSVKNLLNTRIYVGDLPVSGVNPIPVTGTLTTTGATLNILSAISATNYRDRDWETT